MYQSLTARRSERGFTLIELLVVIAIIAILAALILAALNAAQKGSRDSRRQSDVNQYKTALANYYSDNNSYPSGDGNPIAGSTSNPPCNALVTNYLSSCLNGPGSSNTFFYRGGDTTFTVCAVSERDNTKAFIAGPTKTETKDVTNAFAFSDCTGGT